MKYMGICIFLVMLFCNPAEAPPKREFIILLPPPPPPVTWVESIEEIRENALYVLHPTFRNKVIIFLYECSRQGIELEVVETYRSPERQDYLRAMGYTGLSGGKSKHQHYIAVDVVPIENGKYSWYNKKLWKKIGEIGEEQGLTWGGRWKKLVDYPHFEYPISIDSVDTIPMPDTVIIPLN